MFQVTPLNTSYISFNNKNLYFGMFRVHGLIARKLRTSADLPSTFVLNVDSTTKCNMDRGQSPKCKF